MPAPLPTTTTETVYLLRSIADAQERQAVAYERIAEAASESHRTSTIANKAALIAHQASERANRAIQESTMLDITLVDEEIQRRRRFDIKTANWKTKKDAELFPDAEIQEKGKDAGLAHKAGPLKSD
jgi:hypothetical protein